jgi:hypothetical protein
LASFAYAQWTDAPNGSVSTATWQSIGPAAVQTPDFDLVTGRITAVELDPSDSTGNRLYVGTTGGGVWVAENAATSNTSSIAFTPLTDFVQSLTTARDGSISIGAITVQPGETGVIFAGTGDPNGMIDSYYGAGILRSTDSGNSWTSGHALTLVCGILPLPFTLRCNWNTFLHFVVLALVSIVISSCGGSSSGSSGGGSGGESGSSTPAGTYHVAVTLTSTGLSRQVNPHSQWIDAHGK